MRDILWFVRNIDVSRKVGWLDLVQSLTGDGDWLNLADQLKKWTGDPDAQSGYFWASMLAAASAFTGGKPTTTDIEDVITAESPRFAQTRYPRANRGRNVKPIKEIGDPDSIRLAADVISAAIATTVLPDWQWRLVVRITGAIVSADPWKHPAGVRWLLRPAVVDLRTRFVGASFSLDGPSVVVEDLIDEHLKAEWAMLERDAW